MDVRVKFVGKSTRQLLLQIIRLLVEAVTVWTVCPREFLKVNNANRTKQNMDIIEKITWVF